MKDNRYELFPIVDEEGHFLGTIPEATPTMAARYSIQWSICTLSMTTGTYTSSAVLNGRISSLENGTPHAEVMLTWANTSKTPYAER